MSIEPAVLSAYDNEPAHGQVAIEARFPEVVTYVELFRMADRAFTALRHAGVFATLGVNEAQRLRLQVSHALRRPVQIVAETPAVPKTSPTARFH